MSIDMYVSASKRQADSTKGMIQQQLSGYTELERAIGQFVFNSQLLTGAAYDSAKNHYSSVLLPLVKGGKLYSEAVARAVQRFPDEYVATVDSGDLKESELERSIAQLTAQIRVKREQQAYLSSLSSDLPSAERDRYNGSQRSLANSLETLERIKSKVTEKLQKLREFNISSVTLFAELDGLKRNISLGSQLATSSFNGTTFVKPNASQLTWANEINQKWEQSKEDKFILAKGKKTKQWVSYLNLFMYVENPNLITAEELKFNAQYRDKLFLKDEFQNDNDLTITIAQAIRDGIDPFTGKELTWYTKASLAFFALTLVVPTGTFSSGKYSGKMPKAVKFKNGKIVNGSTGQVIKNKVKLPKGTKIKNAGNGNKVSGANIFNVEIKNSLGKNIRNHISKHNYESFKKQADYLTDSQLAQKLEKNSFFNPKWSISDTNEYVEIAYNDLLAQGKTGKQVYEIAGEKITVVIKNDGTLDTSFGRYQLTINDFRK